MRGGLRRRESGRRSWRGARCRSRHRLISESLRNALPKMDGQQRAIVRREGHVVDRRNEVGSGRVAACISRRQNSGLTRLVRIEKEMNYFRIVRLQSHRVAPTVEIPLKTVPYHGSTLPCGDEELDVIVRRVLRAVV